MLEKLKAAFDPVAPIVVGLFAVLISFAADVFDSFNLEERSDGALEHLAQAAIGPAYGGAERIGQQQISIVLVDQAAMDAFEVHGIPMPYEVQADLIEAIADHQPRAIFLDLSYARLQRGYGDEEESQRALKDFVRRLLRVRDRGVPVIIGPVSPRDSGLEPLQAVEQAGVSFNAGGAFPYKLLDEASPPRKMAALTLYDVWRETSGAEALPERVQAETLAIEWAFGASARMQTLLPETVREHCRGGTPGARLATALSTVRRGVFLATEQSSGGPSPLVVACPYFDTLYAHWLSDMPNDALAEAFLKDRIVLVGMDLPYLSDFVQTPLMGRVPGVTAHAMALDNLMQNGAKVTRYPDAVWLGLDVSDLLEFTLTMLGLWLVFFFAGRQGRREGLGWAARLLILSSVAAIGLVVGVFIFHWPAPNVFAMILAGASILSLMDWFGRLRDASAAKGRGKTTEETIA